MPEPTDKLIPLLYCATAKESLGDAIHRATHTARLCGIPVILVYSGEILCVEPSHAEYDVFESWARSRHMARHDRDT